MPTKINDFTVRGLILLTYHFLSLGNLEDTKITKENLESLAARFDIPVVHTNTQVCVWDSA